MQVDVTVETDVSRSTRARQLEGMFDVPAAPHQRQTWKLDAPFEERDWNVGLIVGPSGAGKSTVLRSMFGDERSLDWDAASVVDCFSSEFKMDEIAAVCQAVGFNTVPAWLRPYGVLSNGERFRVHMARLMLEAEAGKPIVVDEFTSVVDRQVAQIGAYAVAKHVRRNNLRFVAATCHYDVMDWLQPDWVLEPATRTFTWRSVQPRPRLDVEVAPVHYSAWQLFAPYHYLTAELHRGARCFCLFVEGQPAAFAGVLHRPHPKARNVKGISRLVTLPDWQGLGLAFVLADTLGASYKAMGQRLHTYPAHPALIRAFDRSKVWALKQKPGYAGGGAVLTTTNPTLAHDRVRKGPGGNTRGIVHGPNAQLVKSWRHGSRPCAVFEYAGPADDAAEARRLVGWTITGAA